MPLIQTNKQYAGASLHHIGLACNNIASTLNYLKPMLPSKLVLSEEIFDPNLRANLLLVSISSDIHLELFVSGEVRRP